MNIKNKVGSRIKELRLSKKLSQEALANIAEVDRTYMTSVENKLGLQVNQLLFFHTHRITIKYNQTNRF